MTLDVKYHANNQRKFTTIDQPSFVAVDYRVVLSGKRIVDESNDNYTDAGYRKLLIEPSHVYAESGGATAREIKEIIGRALTPDPCHCEHDCCGHYHGYADVRWLTLDRMEVTVFSERNY